MSASPSLRIWIAASLAIGTLLAAGAADCHAQYDNDFDAGFPDIADYQYFEPVDLDLNRRPVKYTTGYFFNYDKMILSVTGERTTVGDPTAVVNAQIVFPGNTTAAEIAALQVPTFLLPDGTLPQPPATYTVQNGIQNAPPRAEFGYADRYELGYVDDKGNGWMLGVLDGNEIKSEQVYGFESPTTNGFGSVSVNFRTTPGLLAGWRDFGVGAIELDDAISVGADDDDDTAGVGSSVSGPGGAGADGIIDDVLFNGGTFFIIDGNGDGMFTLGIDPFYTDYGDLSEFNISYETLGVRSISEVDGVEIMRTHVLSNRHWMEKHQNQHLEVGYGARLMKFDDFFLIDGNVDFMGRTFIQTEAENQIVGPQFRLKWAIQKQKLNLSLDGRCMLGYNIGDLSQLYGIGQNLQPGALNRPLLFSPTYGNNGRQEENFSPVVEFRADVKYQVTRSIAVKLGYTAIFIDNITRASQLTDYVLPNPGLLSGGKQDVFVNGLNVGVEFWH